MKGFASQSDLEFELLSDQDGLAKERGYCEGYYSQITNTNQNIVKISFLKVCLLPFQYFSLKQT
jgi:hypothetical protein